MPSWARPDLLARRKRSHELTPTIKDLQRNQRTIEQSIIDDKRDAGTQVKFFVGGVGGGGGGGGGGTNALLDGANHTDTLAGTVVDGDTIIGNATPKWSRLAISIPGAANLLNVFGVINGELRASWKALFDATSPSAVSTSASAGTGTVAARVNHVHAHETAHIAHDTIFDADGDLPRGSGADTAAKLSAPSTWKFLGSAGVSYNDAIEKGVYASRPSASAANVGRLYMATDRANTLYLCDSSSTWAVVNPRVVTLRWNIDGRLRADASNGQGPIRYLPDLDGITTETVALWKPVRVKAHVRTASAGAAITCQIEFGTTATPGTDLLSADVSISAGANEATSTSFADTTIENGTAMELIIDTVGSTAGSEGTDLSVEVEFVQQDA